MVNEFLERQCFREMPSNEVCTTCVHNRSESHCTSLDQKGPLFSGPFFVSEATCDLLLIRQQLSPDEQHFAGNVHWVPTTAIDDGWHRKCDTAAAERGTEVRRLFLCPAALIFVQCILQKNEVLLYGAIDCIAVNSCV